MKRVHYEVRDEDGDTVWSRSSLREIRQAAAVEREAGYEVTVVKVTTEELPLRKKAKR